MKPASVVVVVALLLAAHSPLALSQEPQRGSVGRGWPRACFRVRLRRRRHGRRRAASFVGRPGTERRDAARTRSLHDEGLLPGPHAVVRPALLPLQQPVDTAGDVGRRSRGSREHDRHGAAGERVVGPLRDRLSARERSSRRTRSRRRRSTTKHCSRRRLQTAARRSTRATNPPPDWNGRYSRAISLAIRGETSRPTYEAPGLLAEPPQWFFTSINQTSTILSLLTPEYQRRTVQMHYHQSVNNAPLWPAQFCWPDGFMRVFSRQAHLAMDFVTTPERVQLMASSAENFIRHFNVGRSFDMSGDVPRLGADVPRWFGESIAFWDGDTLITWTSNVMPWITHGVFEFSRQMQTVEIFSPRRAPDGRARRHRARDRVLRRGSVRAAVAADPGAHPDGTSSTRSIRSSTRAASRRSSPSTGARRPLSPGVDDRIHGARHLRSPVGADLGAILRRRHAAARIRSRSSTSHGGEM